MDCERVEDLLSPYLEHDLPAAERHAVAEHLAACGECRSLLACMQEARASLSVFPELDISPDLHSRLAAIPEKKTRFRLSLDFILRPSLQPVFAAATIVLTLFSLYDFNPNRGAINKSIERQLHVGYSKLGHLYAKAESFTNSLAGHKEDLLVSLKNKNPLSRDED